MYDAIAGLSGPNLARAKEILGIASYNRLKERATNASFQVSRPIARKVRDFYRIERNFDGPDSQLSALIREEGLGSFLQSDHLVEQRFIDELIDGNTSFFRRSGVSSLGRDPDRLPDVHAVAVPQNEIIYYKIARMAGGQFRMAGLYPHVGPGSKTSRMNQLLPVGTEAQHSIMDIVNVHLWVTIKEQGLPIQYRDHILDDIAESLASGIEGHRRHPALLRQANDAIRSVGHSGVTKDNIIRYFNRSLDPSGMPTIETFSPTNWPRYTEFERPLSL
jgi:hypothetical protein